MAANVTVTLQAIITGLGGGQKLIQPTAITSGASVATVTTPVLLGGDNTISIPNGAVGMLIVPPSTNTVALVLKGAAPDTGVALHKTNWTFVSVSTQTSFILNVASGVTGLECWFV